MKTNTLVRDSRIFGVVEGSCEYRDPKSINKSSPEYDSLYAYLDTLINLPWDNSSPEVIDIKKSHVNYR